MVRWQSDAQNHHFGGFNQGGGSLARFQMHFSRRTGSNNRRDLLAADRNPDFRHQTANPNGIDSSHELIPPADAAYYLFAFLLGSASRPEKQPVQFTLRDAVMSPNRLHAANLLPVNPLFDGGETDAQL